MMSEQMPLLPKRVASGTYQLADFQQGARLSQRQALWWLVSIFFILLVFYAYLGWSGVSRCQRSDLEILPLIFRIYQRAEWPLMIILTIMMLCRILLYRFVVKQFCRLNEQAEDHLRIEWGERGVIFAGENINTYYPWHHTSGGCSNDKVCLIYLPTECYVIVPRHWFATDDDYQDFCALLKRVTKQVRKTNQASVYADEENAAESMPMTEASSVLPYRPYPVPQSPDITGVYQPNNLYAARVMVSRASGVDGYLRRGLILAGLVACMTFIIRLFMFDSLRWWLWAYENLPPWIGNKMLSMNFLTFYQAQLSPPMLLVKMLVKAVFIAAVTTAIVLIIIKFATNPHLQRLGVRNVLKHNPVWQHPITFYWDEHSLDIHFYYGCQKYTWSSFKALQLVNGDWLLTTKQDLIFVLPQDWFADEAQQQDFLTCAKAISADIGIA